MPTPLLPLDPDQLLSTTRAVRKRLDFDRPVPFPLIEECLELAIQAPTGSNAQGWHFVVVTEAAQREALAAIYQKAWKLYVNLPSAANNLHRGDPEMEKVQERVLSSAEYLAQNLARVPVMLIPCISGRFDAVPPPMGVIAQASSYGSILPAVWSFMLAARARGLGSCWTTMHLMHEEEAAGVLGIPYQEITQCALVPVAYTRGTDFKPAPRKALGPILHRERW